MAPPIQRKQSKINALTTAHLLRLLMDGDRSIQELTDETGMHRITVERWLRALHQQGVVHVCRYDHDVRGRAILRVFKLGPGKDAKRPRLTSAERAKRSRERRKVMQQTMVLAGRGRFVPSANGGIRYEEISP